MTNVKTEVEAESVEAHDLAGIAIAAATEAINNYQKAYGLCEAPFRVVLSVENDEGALDYPVESGPDLLQISENGWIRNDSGECLVHRMDVVEVFQKPGDHLRNPCGKPAKDYFWDLITSYRPLRDEDGVPYCSAEGLEDWAEYVATDNNGSVMQYNHCPSVFDKFRHWDCLDGNGDLAPSCFANTSDHWTNTLRRVWRK